MHGFISKIVSCSIFVILVFPSFSCANSLSDKKTYREQAGCMSCHQGESLEQDMQQNDENSNRKNNVKPSQIH